MGDQFARLATNGPMAAAVAVAALAGLVSFLSPCVLPLVPGYVSYVTGLAGADLDAALGADPHGRPVPPPASGGVAVAARRRVRGRVFAGVLLFIAGYTAVYVVVSVVAARAGLLLSRHQRELEVVVGLMVIVLGLAFAGLVPGLQRELRIHALPRVGLVGAPALGAVFALSWTPCAGPTLGAVLMLATVGGETGRAVVLAIAYCLGLGAPFIAFGLGFRRLLTVFAAVRRHSAWVTRLGGALLVLVGLALVSGGWGDFMNWLRATIGPGTAGI